MKTLSVRVGDFLTTSGSDIYYHRFLTGCFVNFFTDTDGVGIFFSHFNQSFLDTVFQVKVENLLKSTGKKIRYKIVGDVSTALKFEDVFRAYGWQKEKIVEREGETELFYDPQSQKIRVSKPEQQEIKKNTETVIPLSIVKTGKVKVMIVDDSKTIRDLLEKIFARDPSFEVVASIAHPGEVEAAIKKVKPDVITLDIHMPDMNGVELLRRIFPVYKIPTVMISSISPEDGTYVLDALEIGAVDYIKKPEFSELAQAMPVIIEKVKAAANARILSKPVSHKGILSAQKIDQDNLIVIGSSTGGTEALKTILTRLPAQIPPILIVQHIPAVFSEAFANRMDTLCPFRVTEARDGDIVEPSHVYVAPGGKQMKVVKKNQKLQIVITDDAPVNRHKPSVDYLFDSVEMLKPAKLVSVILTGMGGDGARGMKKLRDIGASTIAQNEESCVVFGMPREAIKLGGAEKIIHLDQIADEIVNLIKEKSSKMSAAH